jgi:hypothetical protein
MDAMDGNGWEWEDDYITSDDPGSFPKVPYVKRTSFCDLL